MLDVEKVIEKLLLKHDCVIIPGLGGFVTRYEPPYRDEESECFYPPYCSISFNSQLKLNDGLLVQAYMQAYDTNFPEAGRLVDKEVERIKKELHETGATNFENLGILELKENDRLVFTPQDNGGIAAPSLYGLDLFRIAPYKRHSTEVFTAMPVAVLKEKEETPKTEESKKPHYTIHLNRRITNYAAVALVAVIFYFAFAIPVSNDSVQKGKRSITAMDGALYGFPISHFINDNGIDNNKGIATTAKRHVTAKQVGGLVKQQKDAATMSKEASAKSKDAPYYTIVVASAIQKDNAKTFAERLVSEGYTQARVFSKEKMVRVVYSQFSSKEEAQKELRSLRELEMFRNAWVLHVN